MTSLLPPAPKSRPSASHPKPNRLLPSSSGPAIVWFASERSSSTPIRYTSLSASRESELVLGLLWCRTVVRCRCLFAANLPSAELWSTWRLPFRVAHFGGIPTAFPRPLVGYGVYVTSLGHPCHPIDGDQTCCLLLPTISSPRSASPR